MEIELSRIFVKVIQSGSFTKAAEILQLPKSSVSRAIVRLEEESQTKLIIRTTRSLSLTEAGRIFYEACLPAIQTLEEAQKSLQGKDKSIAGLVKITAPEDLGTAVISSVIADLAKKYPLLNFELSFSDKVVDIVKEGFDIAIRLGKRVDSTLKLRPAGEVILIAVASPTYLKNHPKIKHPLDLNNHTCLSHNWSKHWIMKSNKGSVTVPIKPKILSNQMISMLTMAVAGNGISFVPKYLCQPYLESGELVRILPEWSSPPVMASIITPLAPSSSGRIKVTVDAIYFAMKETLK